MSITGVGVAQSQPQWPTFQSTDTDGDDELSLQEFGAAGQNVPGGISSLGSQDLQSLFSAIDANSDGQISRGEATSAFSKLSNAVQSQLLGVQEQSGPLSPQSLFASADTDGSGGLSIDEFKASVTQNLPDGATAPNDDQLQSAFNKIDTNGDGQLSQSELKAAHHGHHHHGGPPPSQTSDSSNTDSIFGPDPFSTATSSTSSADATDPNDPNATASTSPTALPTDLNSLLLQAVSAYTDPIGTASNVVNQVLDALKAA
jgi:Ca2+-binding EF-hand superfamily protein